MQRSGHSVAGGYSTLVLLVIGCGLALWLFMYATPVREGVNGKSDGQSAIDRANAVQGMADHRSGEIEEGSQQ